ncbi:MAG: hypothetical protein ACLFRI_00050 [Candidatus Izemoplasmataceae bacterium]
MNIKLEKLNILEQLDEGKITLEKAQELLNALKETKEVKKEVEPVKETKTNGRTLKIKILSSDGDVVNVSVPINFARLLYRGGKGFIKNSTLDDMNVNMEEVFDMIDQGVLGELVNIESADGDKVLIAII